MSRSFAVDSIAGLAILKYKERKEMGIFLITVGLLPVLFIISALVWMRAKEDGWISALLPFAVVLWVVTFAYLGFSLR